MHADWVLHLQACRVLDVNAAAYVAACVVLALEHLHYLGKDGLQVCG
jgi:hypothetical protein